MLIKKKTEDQEKYKLYYDASHRQVSFSIGDEVLVLFDAPVKGFLVPRWVVQDRGSTQSGYVPRGERTADLCSTCSANHQVL